MRTIQWSDPGYAADVAQELASLLVDGELVCLPCNGRYRIVADLTNEDAVMQLVQAKRRIHKAPALAFIDHVKSLNKVAGEVDPLTLRIARQLWPRPLTIRVPPSPELPRKVLRQLGKKARLGVRIPSDPLARAVVAAAGRPLLVSSANKERKAGARSPAQVRRTFAARVAVFIDQGDLKPGPPSTVIEVAKGKLLIKRQGAVTEELLRDVSDG